MLALGGKAVHIPADTTWELELLSDFDPSQKDFYEVKDIGELPALVEKLDTETRQD